MLRRQIIKKSVHYPEKSSVATPDHLAYYSSSHASVITNINGNLPFNLMLTAAGGKVVYTVCQYKLFNLWEYSQQKQNKERSNTKHI